MVLFFGGSFAPHFQIKLSTHGSNFNSKFVIMRELKFILLMRVLTQNFNIVDLVKFLYKNQKLHIQIMVITLKATSCKTMSKKNKMKKNKIYDFIGKRSINLLQLISSQSLKARFFSSSKNLNGRCEENEILNS
jgi:hypothetical protein